MPRKSKPLNLKDVPDFPAEMVWNMKYPSDMKESDKATCHRCGKKKTLSKLKYIGIKKGEHLFKCKSGRCKPKEVMSPPSTHENNVSKRTYNVSMTIMIEEVTNE